MPRAQLPSQILPTAADTRVREHQYDDLDIGSFQGWDPDSGDFERPINAFYEMHNYRFDNRGTPLLRRGVTEYHYLNSKEGQNGGAEPYTAIGTCEYVIWAPDGAGGQTELRYNVVLEHEAGTQLVRLVLMDKGARSNAGMDAITVATNVAAAPSGCLWQFGLYIIVSLFDGKTYILWPTKLPFSRGDWTMEVLGKDECPTPASYDFPLDLKGDLIAYSVHNKNSIPNLYVMEYDTVSETDPTIPTFRLPIEAKYTRAGGAVFNLHSSASHFGLTSTSVDEDKIVATDIIPRWRAAKKDGGSAAGNAGAADLDHLMHRGYFYRFVFVRTITLPNGEKIKLRSNPSSDLFVPAVIYAPFFWTGDKDASRFPRFITGSDVSSWKFGPAGPDDLDVAVGGGHDDWQPVPNTAAMTDLQLKYRRYFHDTAASDSVGTGGSLHWIAHWLRWNHGALQDNLLHKNFGAATVYAGQPPYKCDVTAEELTGAPQTIFSWFAFFDTLDAAEAVEIYRTAYEGVDPEKRATETPTFAPHTYGYVGRLDSGGTWTDTTKTPDFGKTPEQHNGYLRGQFSGDVIYDYGQSPALVLGNVRVDYSLLTPSPLVQAATFAGGDYGAAYVQQYDAFSATASDNERITHFLYCYEDNNGYISAAVNIPTPSAPSVNVPNSSRDSGLGVCFTFPYGYAPSIEHILLFCSRWKDSPGWTGTPGQDTAGSRTLVQIARIDPEPGTYFSNGAETGKAVPAAYPGGDHAKFYEPGAVIYSKPKQPWDWPQRNSEIHHVSAPVRGLFELMGELLVLTENSATLTLLSSTKPRSETETKWIACVSKFACAKVGEVVVFLSQDGLYYMVPSGPIKLDGQDPKQAGVETVVRRYIEEQIPNQKWLANARRASLVYHGRRGELLLHLPSSVDLQPTDQKNRALPQRTIVYKFFGGDVRNPEHYSFDISPSFEIKNVVLPTLGEVVGTTGGVTIEGDEVGAAGAFGGIVNFDDGSPITLFGPAKVDLGTYTPRRVLMSAGLDGSLWGTWSADDGKSLVIASLDDVTTDYQGTAYLTLAITKQLALATKKKRKVEIRMAARGIVSLTTGIAKRDGSWDAERGPIHDSCRIWPFLAIRADQMRSYAHPYNGTSRESEGKLVFWRLRSGPDVNGLHFVDLANIALRLITEHAQ